MRTSAFRPVAVGARLPWPRASSAGLSAAAASARLIRRASIAAAVDAYSAAAPAAEALGTLHPSTRPSTAQLAARRLAAAPSARAFSSVPASLPQPKRPASSDRPRAKPSAASIARRLLAQGRALEAGKAVEQGAWSALEDVVEGMAQAGHGDEAEALLRLASERRVDPRDIASAWARMVDALRQTGRVRAAAAAAERMLEAEPARWFGPRCHTAAVAAHARLAMDFPTESVGLERARAVLERAAAGKEAAEEAHVVFAGAVLRVRGPEEAVAALEAGGVAGTRHFPALLDECAERGDWAAGCRLWRYALDRGIPQNLRLGFAYLRLCLACEAEAARDLAAELAAAGLRADADGLARLVSQRVKAAGEQPGPSFFAYVVAHLAVTGRAEAAREWVEAARAAGYGPLYCFVSRMRAWIFRGETDKVRRLLAFVEGEGLVVAPSPSAALLEELRKEDGPGHFSFLANLAWTLLDLGRSEDAFSLLRVAAGRGVPLRQSLFAALLAGCAERRSWADGRALWRMALAGELPVRLGQEAADAYTRLCVACGAEALEALEGALAAAGLPPSPDGLARLAERDAAAASSPKKAPPSVAAAPERGEIDGSPSSPPRPTALSFVESLAAATRAGDASAASGVLGAMRASGFELITEPSISPQLAEELRQAAIPSRNALLSSMADGQLLVGGDAATFLAACSRAGVPLLPYVFGGPLSSCARAGRWAEGHALRSLAVRLGVPLSPFARHAYLRLCLACEAEAARDLAGELAAAGLRADADGLARLLLAEAAEAGARFDAITFCAVIDRLVAKGELEAARAWVAEARAADAVDLGTYLHPLRGALQRADVPALEQLLDEMAEDGYGLVPTVGPRVLADLRRMDRALALAIVAAIARASVAAGRVDAVIALLRECHGAGVRMDAGMAGTVAYECGRWGRPHEARAVLDLVRELDLPRTPVHFRHKAREALAGGVARSSPRSA